MRASRSTRGQIVGLASVCLALALGCDPVREDRTIQFTNSGDRVAFQHGSDGIFVADPRTGALRKVFDADASIVAVSTPQWSRDESFAIFSTARDELARNQPAAAAGTPSGFASRDWNEAPEGRSFFAQSIVYTCYRVRRDADGTFGKPAALFEAHCNHAGYVAANLAVRLSPNENSIAYIDRSANGGHAVWLFDRSASRAARVFPPPNHPTPAHVIVDFVPGTDQLVCVAGAIPGEQPPPANAQAAPRGPDDSAGIWIGRPGNADWWHVAESVDGSADVPRGLSDLIARRPVFSRDGRMLAFLQSRNGTSKRRTTVFRGRLGNRTAEKICESAGEISDLHWSADGEQLGFVAAEPSPALTLIDSKGTLRHLFADRRVAHFAGWNASGSLLACVVPEHVPPKAPQTWALLLPPDPLSRDALIVADASGHARTVAGGFRFSFPQWSSKQDRISTWGTFTPSHHVFAVAGPWGFGIGLRRGDPAAVVDVAAGAIRWMAINGDEEAQVGHYYLIHHDFPAAREWYRKADQHLAPLKALRPEELFQALSGTAARRRTFELFYSYCLSKLGEPAEAAARLQVFETSHRIEWPPISPRPPVPTGGQPAAAPANNPAAAWNSPESRRGAERLVSIAKCLTVAQVYLSVDDVAAAEAYFKRRIDEKDSPDALGSLLAQSQILLLKGQNREFADLAADRLAPLLVAILDDQASDWGNRPLDARSPDYSLTLLLAGYAVGPLFCVDFLKELPAERVAAVAAKFSALRERARGEASKLGVDLVLRAAGARLGNKPQQADAESRIAKNSARAHLLPEGGIEAHFATVRSLSQSPPAAGL